MKRTAYILLTLMLAFVAVGEAAAQRMPERGLVRKGNRQFARERYNRSADSYREALKHDSTSFEARYDLASALIRTERYEEAEQLLQQAAQDSIRTEGERAEAYYNLGNAQFAQQKLQEALQSYRNSLLLNPDDQETKYNYAYTKKLLEQQNQDQNQNQNNDQQQDQNQNDGGGQNDNQGGDQNEDKNDQQQNDNKQDGDQNPDQQGDNPNDGNQNPNEGDGEGDQEDKEQPNTPPRGQSGMSKEQQEQLLNAIQAQEDKTQEKLDEKAKGVVIKGKKNW